MVWISIITMIVSKAVFTQICLLSAVMLLSPAVQCIFAVGVRLTLNGAVIANDSYVNIGEVGVGHAALLCHTDQSGCCFSNQKGHWYFPNGTTVESLTNNINAGRHTNIFIRNRGTGVVRLNRFQSPLERGRFYCVVPDAKNMDQTLYVNIGMFIALIIYNLQATCSCRL